ncbi:hypothetical protein BU15DRAFT_65620 [Melanogaster broomeanus]|nr:hypothetical protein BU15DRAFT_65620 [Melanogaster broomeanus]
MLSSTHTSSVSLRCLWLMISLERISEGAFSPHHDVDTCHTMTYVITMIFGLRTYAMWYRSRPVLIITCCTLTASVGALMFIFFRFIPSVTCASPILFASFVVIMLAEAVTTSFMLYRACRHFRHAPNVLIQNLTRDGVFYFLSMFAPILTGPCYIPSGDAYYPRDADAASPPQA